MLACYNAMDNALCLSVTSQTSVKTHIELIVRTEATLNWSYTVL